MMLYGVLKDPVRFPLLEADLLQYYNIDIYDFYRGKIYVRRLVDLMISLPPDSRLLKRERNDPLDVNHHLMMNVVDAMNLMNFQTYYVAAGAMGKEWKKIFKNAPKPGDRPKLVEEEKPKKKFLTGAELKAAMGMTKANDVAHKPGCKGKDADGVLCSCPPKSRRKQN